MINEQAKLNQLQSHLLEMMKAFHTICEDNNLTYYLLYGTLLGAVRHGGFIPWDDDIDVGMPREDYDKLMNLPPESFPNNLVPITKWFGQEKGSFLYAKLVDTKTTLIESVEERQIGGIFIDIFPIDGGGKTKLTAYIKMIVSRIFSSIMRLNYKQIKHKNKLKRIGQLLFKNFNNEKIYKLANNFLKLNSFSKSRYCLNFIDCFNFKEIVLKEVYGIPTLYEFEDSKFYGPRDAHTLLINTYGDYQKLPPIENRKSHHYYEYLDFDIGFEEYSKLNFEI